MKANLISEAAAKCIGLQGKALQGVQDLASTQRDPNHLRL